MPWERYNFFFLTDRATVSPEKEEVFAVYDLISQSDYFGYALKNLFDYFNNFIELYFLIPQEIYFDRECFEHQAHIFDQTQQKIVIAEIDHFLEKLVTIPIEVLEQHHIFSASELGKNETIALWIQASQNVQYENFDCYDIDYFMYYLQALQLIKQFFQQALDQDLYLIYKTLYT